MSSRPVWWVDCCAGRTAEPPGRSRRRRRRWRSRAGTSIPGPSGSTPPAAKESARPGGCAGGQCPSSTGACPAPRSRGSRRGRDRVGGRAGRSARHGWCRSTRGHWIVRSWSRSPALPSRATAANTGASVSSRVGPGSRVGRAGVDRSGQTAGRITLRRRHVRSEPGPRPAPPDGPSPRTQVEKHLVEDEVRPGIPSRRKRREPPWRPGPDHEPVGSRQRSSARRAGRPPAPSMRLGRGRGARAQGAPSR